MSVRKVWMPVVWFDWQPQYDSTEWLIRPMQTDRWLAPINLISFMIDRNECTRSVYTWGIQCMHELIKSQTQRAEIRPEATNEKWKQRTSLSLPLRLVLTCPRGKGKVVILVIRSSVSHFHSTVVHIDSLLRSSFSLFKHVARREK